MAYFFISHDNATYFGVECRKIAMFIKKCDLRDK